MIHNQYTMKLDLKGLAILAVLAAAVAFFLLFPGKGTNTIPPGISVQTIDGQPLALDSLGGKPYLLTFWSTTCPGCVGEIPVLEALEQKMQGTGFRVVAVAMPYDKPSAIQSMRIQKGMTYTVAHDQSGALVKQFDVRVTPTSFLVGGDGKVAAHKLGEWQPADLERRVRDLLQTQG